jgi:H(+)-translocating pyrophosphatase
MALLEDSEVDALVIASVPFLGGIVALIMVAVLMARVNKAPVGEGKQLFIAKQISEGATSFLKTEYTYLLPFVVAVAAFIVGILEGQDTAPTYFEFVPSKHKGGWQTMICFLLGAALSASAGWAGMKVATQTNVKTMEAARTGLNPALQIAFAGGAVMGFSVVAFGILGLTVLFYIFATAQNTPSITINGATIRGSDIDMRDAIRYLSGFGFGASAIALFARVAGGIYTKAADVGADLVGKVESDIPEDDPRNPATVADNVGDNVGDVAGMGADLFESFCGSIIACAALSNTNRELALPFWISGFGILAATIGFWTVSTKDNATQSELLHALHRGVYSSSVLVVVFSVFCVEILFDGNKQGYRYFGCVILGLAAGILIGEATEFCTSYAYGPTKSITHAGSAGGAATVIIQGLGIGMISVFPPTIIIVATVIACFNVANGGAEGLYGISIAAVGMLSTLGVTLATDAYGPVADNAGGIAEMSPDVPEEVRDRTDRLDALGNTTAATGKGFAIGSAVLTALSLMNAFVKDVPYDLNGSTRGLANAMLLTDAYVLSGVIIGAMLPFLFAALTMLSVRKAAGAIIVEVQRQFRTIPGLLEGKEGVVCDHMACVTMCTKASINEMLLPGILAVMTPISVGLLIGAKCLGGLLAGAIASGFMLAVMMSNAGGAWDNSKKYIENEKVYGGKKSDTHKACVVGDTVGDPFKDTSGPALNILIKLMTIFSLTMAPVFRSDWKTYWYGLIVLAVEIIMVGVAYWHVWVVNGEKCVPPEEQK